MTADRRIEPCLCGGVIAADPLDPDAIRSAIRDHQRTSRHEEWSFMGGMNPRPLIWELIRPPRQRPPEPVA